MLQVRARLRDAFRQKTREEWCATLQGHDVCFAPVLSLAEAPTHPHHRARGKPNLSGSCGQTDHAGPSETYLLVDALDHVFDAAFIVSDDSDSR